MSIQTKILKRDGKEVTYYYPVVSTYKINKSKTPLWGPGFPRKSDAVKEEARMKLYLADILKELHDTTPKTFAEVKASWLSTRAAKDDSTKDRDRDYCRIYLSVFDDILINEITAMDIQNWVTMLSEKYAPKTVNMAFNLMSQIMNFAISPLGMIKNNPCDSNIQRPKIRRKGVENDKYWTQEELNHFINHPIVQKDSYYRMILIHTTLGMRPGEICGLNIFDYNKATGSITLNHGLDKKLRLTDLKNTGAQRTLKLPQSLIQPFEEQMAYSSQLRRENAKYDYLFVLENGDPISPDTYCQHLQRLIDKVNRVSDIKIKRITPYGLRHTFATLLLLKGIHIKAVAELMGDSVETVMRNYAHIQEQLTSSSLESMAEIIFSQN